jgi:hypothetical protein
MIVPPLRILKVSVLPIASGARLPARPATAVLRTTVTRKKEGTASITKPAAGVIVRKVLPRARFSTDEIDHSRHDQVAPTKAEIVAEEAGLTEFATSSTSSSVVTSAVQTGVGLRAFDSSQMPGRLATRVDQ